MKPGAKTVPLERLKPNPWNPNKMPPHLFTKLVTGIEKLREQSREVPPITVRPDPDSDGDYQIIDGFHRYKAFKRLGIDEMSVFVIDVDEPTARILTANLNYLRGEADEKEYGELLGYLVEQGGMTLDELQRIFPEDSESLLDAIEKAEGANDIMRILAEQEEAVSKGEEDKEEDLDEDSFVDLRFTVSVAQAKVIEAEVDRIEVLLSGRNRRGRALEFMSVLSGQTPLESLAGVVGADEMAPKVRKPKKGKGKKKKRQKGDE